MPSIRIEGLTSLMSKLKSLPEEGKKQVLTDSTEYSLDVIRKYPPQNYVTRTAAYGQPFQSDKQRRWFFWALSSGMINVPYHRTNGLADSWKAVRGENGIVFSNDYPGAYYVMGSPGQSRHEKLVGWKQIGNIVDRELSGMSSKFRTMLATAYQKAIRKLNLG